MNGKELLDAIGFADETFVAEAAAKPHKKRLPTWRRAAVLAACLCLAVGGAAVAAEAKEYRSAVAFFNENQLPLAGLTRSEVKKVWRDVTTETFSYKTTAEVLKNSGRIPGTELTEEQPTPQEIASLWALFNNASRHRDYVFEDVWNEADATFVKSRLSRYEGEEVLWTTEFSDFCIDDCLAVSGGTVVWGRAQHAADYTSCLALLDETGARRWEIHLKHGLRQEIIEKVIENKDGSLTVMGRAEWKTFVFARYSRDGSEEVLRTTPIGNLGIRNAVPFGDGYVVQLGNSLEETEKVVKVSADGELTDSFVYTSDDCVYVVADMAEFAGKLYLSTYTYPKRDDGKPTGGRDEIAGILQAVGEDWEIGSGELTRLLRRHFTAVLLVCDPDAGNPQTFTSVPGCLAGELTASAGRLEWNVMTFRGAVFSPATSAFTIAADCGVTRYLYDSAGTLLGREKTGETTVYRR